MNYSQVINKQERLSIRGAGRKNVDEIMSLADRIG